MTNLALPHRLTIIDELSIVNGVALREQLLQAFEEFTEIELDLTQVTEIDCAGLQLMIAAKREALIQGKRLRFSGFSAVVLDLLDLADLTGYFDDATSTPPLAS